MNQFGHPRFEHHTQQDAGQGDPDLAGREVDLQLFGHVPGEGQGAAVTEVVPIELTKPCQGEFGGHEQGVQTEQHQAADNPDNNFKIAHAVPLFTCSVSNRGGLFQLQRFEGSVNLPAGPFI